MPALINVPDILIAIGRKVARAIDFEAKDGKPVRLIFLIGTPKQMVTDYLRVVGTLARLLRQDDLRQRLPRRAGCRCIHQDYRISRVRSAPQKISPV